MTKNIIITGTSRGLGLELARLFIKEDFTVIGCSRSPGVITNSNYYHYCLDLSDEKLVKEMFLDIRKNHSDILALINNAGISHSNYILTSSGDEIQKVLKSNVIGVHFVTREALKLMQKGGRVVFLSSFHTQLNTMGTAFYSGSKAFIEEYMKVASKEVIEPNKTFNTIALSYVEGVGMSEKFSLEQRKKIIAGSGFQKNVTTQDVFFTLNFILSQNSHAMTGQVITLGGTV